MLLSFKAPSKVAYSTFSVRSSEFRSCFHKPRFSSTTTNMSEHKPSSLHELTAVDAHKKEFNFANLKGKPVLVVNVASQCGFTPQYHGLQKLYQEYHDKGLEIVGFPCNQFGWQEPGDEEKILDFCDRNYKVTFPIMSKIDVNGSHTHPVYEFLKKSKSGFLGLSLIKWNFEKFLVDKDGHVVHRYGSSTKPDSIAKDIEKEIAK
eukprot:TRINITY_DN2000_c0_g1_i1.p1 TRINITY_DN2000_c0_g1~~TRINITY_DN2000_c0_g1_i1.p1  ORF type:complete len:205 (+),score=33.10 TRINITY_DN2000_c0_g1_i1:65-679(+)